MDVSQAVVMKQGYFYTTYFIEFHTGVRVELQRHIVAIQVIG